MSLVVIVPELLAVEQIARIPSMSEIWLSITSGTESIGNETSACFCLDIMDPH